MTTASSIFLATTGQQTTITWKCFLEQRRTEVLGNTMTAIGKDLIVVNNFSQRLKLRALIIKMKNLQNKTRTRDQQIIDAENFRFRLSQSQLFDEEVNQLTHDNPIQKRSRLIQFDTFNRRRGNHSFKLQTSQRIIFNSNEKTNNLRRQEQGYTPFSGIAAQHQWSCCRWTANSQHSVELLCSSMQNSNEEDLKQTIRMQTTKTTQQLSLSLGCQIFRVTNFQSKL